METMKGYGFVTTGQYETRHKLTTKRFMKELRKMNIVGVSPIENNSGKVFTDVVYIFWTQDEAKKARQLAVNYGYPASEVKPVDIPTAHFVARYVKENR